MKFTNKNARKFGWKGIKGLSYTSKDDFPEMSCARVAVTGRHGKIKNVKCNRLYFVISGKGEFSIDDEIIKCKKDDVIIIPKNTPYDYRGKMNLLLVDTPAFEPGTDVKC